MIIIVVVLPSQPALRTAERRPSRKEPRYEQSIVCMGYSNMYRARAARSDSWEPIGPTNNTLPLEEKNTFKIRGKVNSKMISFWK